MITISNSENWLLQQANLRPEHTAVKSDIVNLTFRELYELCSGTAAYLISCGIQEKNHVGILFDHSHEFIVIVNALWSIGAIPVPLNTRNTKDEIEVQLDQAEIKFLIISESFSKIQQVINSSIIIIFSPTGIKFQPGKIQTSTFKPQNPSLILFTSGSSDEPKAVVHTFESLFESVKSIDSFANLSTDNIWLSSLPLYHIGGFMIFVRSIIIGSPVVFPQTLKHEDIVEAINNFRPSHISIVSTTLKKLLEKKFLPGKNLKYIFLGGGILDEALCTAAINAGFQIVKVYGSTETCSMISALSPDEFFKKPNSVGKTIGANKIKITNKNGFDKNTIPGEIGEIVVKSNSLLKAYYNDKELTGKKLKDGFYYTGDFGRIDNEGYLYIESRREDLVITGGENVNTLEVESAIKTYPSVTDAYVFGIDDNTWGQKLCAAVSVNMRIENDLKVFLKNKLAGYKIPKEFFFVDGIPKTELGKVNRTQLFKLLNLS